MTNEIQPIRRILFPTDFSPSSEHAFRYVENLASSMNADLVILHVFEIPDYWGAGGSPVEIDKEIKKKLKDIKPSDSGINVEYVAHGGKAGEVICWVAQDRNCDEIVMSTHGHKGLMHLLLGSVAEYVVRHARCPVLTVREPAEKEPPLKEPVAYQSMPPIL